jgi:hypothetical protein
MPVLMMAAAATLARNRCGWRSVSAIRDIAPMLCAATTAFWPAGTVLSMTVARSSARAVMPYRAGPGRALAPWPRRSNATTRCSSDSALSWRAQ